MSKPATYVVIVTFPSAPAGAAQYELREKATEPAVAISRAIKRATLQLHRNTRYKHIPQRLTEVGRVTWSKVEEAAPKPQEVEHA